MNMMFFQIANIVLGGAQQFVGLMQQQEYEKQMNAYYQNVMANTCQNMIAQYHAAVYPQLQLQIKPAEPIKPSKPDKKAYIPKEGAKVVPMNHKAKPNPIPPKK